MAYMMCLVTTFRMIVQKRGYESSKANGMISTTAFEQACIESIRLDNSVVCPTIRAAIVSLWRILDDENCNGLLGR